MQKIYLQLYYLNNNTNQDNSINNNFQFNLKYEELQIIIRINKQITSKMSTMYNMIHAI